MYRMLQEQQVATQKCADETKARLSELQKFTDHVEKVCVHLTAMAQKIPGAYGEVARLIIKETEIKMTDATKAALSKGADEANVTIKAAAEHYEKSSNGSIAKMNAVTKKAEKSILYEKRYVVFLVMLMGALGGFMACLTFNRVQLGEIQDSQTALATGLLSQKSLQQRFTHVRR